jgi:tetratricopeptide (TPR) repeat protein
LKKYILTCIFIFLICLAFADVKKEIENIVKKDVNSKEFQQANKLVNSFQEQGSKLADQGKYDQAMQCYLKALDKANELFGKESTAASMIYTSMGSLFLKKKKKLKAADSLVKASDIYKKSMGGMLIPHNYYVLRLHAASIYCDLKKYTVGLNILKELEKRIKQLPQKRRAKVYCLLAECYYSENKFAKAIKYCKMANKEIPNDINTDNFKARNYDIWATCLVSLGKRKEAIEKLKISLKYASQTNMSIKFIGQLLLNIGTNYMELDEYKKAKGYMFKALIKFNIIEKERDLEEGITYLYLARNARYHNKWKEAEINYVKSAKLLEKYLALRENTELNKSSLKQTEGTAFMALCIVYKWLQKCFHKNKAQIKAIEIYLKIAKWEKQYKNSIYIADIYPSLIANYIDLKKYKQALLITKEGMLNLEPLPVSSQRQSLMATFCYLDAKIMFLSGDKEKAIKKCKNALTLFKKINPRSNRVKLISKKLEEWKTKTPSKQ